MIDDCVVNTVYCRVCNSPFAPIKSNQRFCSHKCKKKYTNKIYYSRKTSGSLKEGRTTKTTPIEPKNIENTLDESVLINLPILNRLDVLNNHFGHVLNEKCLEITITRCLTCAKKENREVLLFRSPGKIVRTSSQRKHTSKIAYLKKKRLYEYDEKEENLFNEFHDY